MAQARAVKYGVILMLIQLPGSDKKNHFCPLKHYTTCFPHATHLPDVVMCFLHGSTAPNMNINSSSDKQAKEVLLRMRCGSTILTMIS